MGEIVIKINGYTFQDWNELTVRKELEAIAGNFEFNAVQTSKVLSIGTGDKVEIFINNIPLIHGYIDYIAPDLRQDDRSIQVVGRDNTCDIIDCTHSGSKREFTGNQSIVAIIQELVKLFGIEVVNQLGESPRIKTLKIDPGETLFESIEKATRQLGIILQPSGDGKLLLTKITKDKKGTLLEEGYDFLDCFATYNAEERFSDYILKAQDKNNKSFVAKAKDPDIKRYRPLELISDINLEPAEAQKKINWEANIRAARAVDVSVTMQGWTNHGKPWLPNVIFNITSPKLALYDCPLLLRSIDYYFDSNGTTTNLSFTRSDAYSPDPIQRERKSGIDVTKYGYGI